MPSFVIPAQAGIQKTTVGMDSRFHRNGRCVKWFGVYNIFSCFNSSLKMLHFTKSQSVIFKKSKILPSVFSQVAKNSPTLNCCKAFIPT